MFEKIIISNIDMLIFFHDLKNIFVVHTFL